MPTPAKITAILTAKPGKESDLLALIEAMAPHCRSEPGNLRWDIWQDQSQPGRYVLDELYVDEAAIAAHRQTPHFLDYLARVGDIADRMAIVSTPVSVADKG
ncbi:putative quinol monooxygenase [Radicibacter daui]|uniref:putative quinol monooxygenase n=1 Tax=Radicibacter daui TaxID=3064829 RepID=UPI004046A250